ncbi:hydroxymethylbilane synthase [Legionella micdadei]|uniref:Porphobilinogen deaminase n=1 Tax=Legionella micdadei TaxID=451 RepID=A0A098GJA2_LEGMI|nr:hydroxymethylbilane synthase [Legionella micdadei]ARG96548.1 hydroxymethylbilane synthase [Legionella micdadei]ARG99296.1 hydroxymethylbilane synthase [Legionella micdadei]KTD27382.1 porphobilinogen deaminase [Legionella micdadei]NSL18829.1 hydroxymethylbilane synthase [Legionella micdadei]CEG62092.1 Porphobilinogen deaminase [Legionella micdadei]
MAIKIIRIATRKSPLALWQANYVGENIRQHWPAIQIELVPMVTSGDKFLKDKLLAAGGKGLFVKELEEALLGHQADIAVHSMKDVPAIFPDGLALTTICTRHNPLDALIGKNHLRLSELPKGSVVGTTSLRRQSQLLAVRPDLEIKPLRGNINTRLDKLQSNEYDAIVLAVAGLERMGLDNFVSEILNEDAMLPACGQGALGIECRVDDLEIQKLLAPLNDPLSALCVSTERRVNALLGGNCHVPLAVYCTGSTKEQLLLRAKVLTPDGKTVISDRRTGLKSQATALAEACANALLAKGANAILTTPS